MASGRETVLIVSADDHLANSLEQLFCQHGLHAIVARTEAAALIEGRQNVPSLVLVDRQRANLDKLLHEPLFRNVPIVALQGPKSNCPEDECIEDLTRGADASLCNDSYRVLLARIRAILRTHRNHLTPSRSYVVGAICMDIDRHEVMVHGRSVDLTTKEFHILRQFLESPQRALTRQELLNRVWGEDYALEEHALDVHIHSLRHKIEQDPSRPTLIVTVRGVGYKLKA